MNWKKLFSNAFLFLESIAFSLGALKSNLLRTILSLLGVTVGIFSIIAVFTLVDSLEKSIKDSMNFLFSSSTKTTKSKNLLSLSTQPRLENLKKTVFSFSKDMNFIQNFVFQKNMNFYGSTEFMSPYEGELVPMHTHDTYWWKKASEISTLQKFEKLFTIITKKDLFSVEFPLENPYFEKMNSLPKAEKSFNNEEIFENSKDKKRTSFPLLSENKKFHNKFSLKERQKHLKKLYEVVSEISQKNNSFQNIMHWVAFI